VVQQTSLEAVRACPQEAFKGCSLSRGAWSPRFERVACDVVLDFTCTHRRPGACSHGSRRHSVTERGSPRSDSSPLVSPRAPRPGTEKGVGYRRLPGTEKSVRSRCLPEPFSTHRGGGKLARVFLNRNRFAINRLWTMRLWAAGIALVTHLTQAPFYQTLAKTAHRARRICVGTMRRFTSLSQAGTA
jgi:hypothetical protein